MIVHFTKNGNAALRLNEIGRSSYNDRVVYTLHFNHKLFDSIWKANDI
jgi:hypothetical protein